jgi:FkbM family methyltransferase
MKILLDVGAHTGQTVRAALDPAYGFDRIFAFEPAPQCWPRLAAITDSRVRLCRFGLWRETCKRELHDAGTQAASILDDFETDGHTAGTTTIQLIRASDWFAENLSKDDIVFMKLNCEGSEVDIVEDLLAAREFHMVYNAMITFDVRKSRSHRGRELPLRRRLLDEGYENVAYAEDVLRGTTHAARIRHWLDLVGARENMPLGDLRARYGSVLRDLARRTGRLARFELFLRIHLFRRLPGPLKSISRRVWGRLVLGRRQGPERPPSCR